MKPFHHLNRYLLDLLDIYQNSIIIIDLLFDFEFKVCATKKKDFFFHAMCLGQWVQPSSALRPNTLLYRNMFLHHKEQTLPDTFTM